MGVYNTYGENPAIQLKVANHLTCAYFKIGDTCDLPDGIYVGHNGFVVVHDTKVLATYHAITSSHGDVIRADAVWPTNKLWEIQP